MKTSQQGFSLIEVMIASFVIIVGVLGVTAAQVSSLKNNQSAYFRSQANFLVADMLDRMRANTEAYDSGSYNNIDSTNALPQDPACATTPAGCSVENLAIHDIREWLLFFAPHTASPLIPGASATITTNTAFGVGGTGDVTISITWNESINNNIKVQTVTVAGRI